MASVMQTSAEDYKTYNANAEIAIQVTAASDGLTSAIYGERGFAMSSRELKEYEEARLTKRVIGTDAVAVIVNLENPFDNISMEQLKGVYDGGYEKWSDIKQRLDRCAIVRQVNIWEE